MSTELYKELPELLKKRKVRRQFTKAETEAMQDDARWEDSQEARDMVRAGLSTAKDFESLFPQDYGKAMAPEGAWIQIKDPPPCEFSVPPFSIWFAVPWFMNKGSNGVKPKRVKIITPSGALGVFPHEYMPVKNISEWVGREPEGIYLRTMNARPVCDTDQLFYLMSRGITRQRATIMLIGQIKDPTFLWIEIAPQYGEYFGKNWPAPERCPFATPKDQFIAIPEGATA